MKPATRAHDTGLVQALADDHHGDDRYDGVAGKAVEQVLRGYKRLFELEQQRTGERHQAQQHHDADRGDIDLDDLEDEQEYRQQQDARDPGDFRRRHHAIELDTNGQKDDRADQTLDQVRF